MIYFIECAEFVKIGFSEDPESRLRDLQAATPFTLKLLAVIPGSLERERTLHRKFSKIRHRGEWFYKTDYLLFCISDLTKYNELPAVDTEHHIKQVIRTILDKTPL